MVMPIMPARHIYDDADPDADAAALVAAMQAAYPSWRPAETDPLLIAFRVLGSHFYRGNVYFNARARGAFAADAVGTDLDGVCENFGVLRHMSELDEALRRRRDTHVRAVGRSSGYSGYEADALDADSRVSDVAVTLDTAPNEGRVIANIIATAAASETRADNLLGVPTAALVAAVQSYLRDRVRVRVGDEDVIARAAAPTEYRIAVGVSPASAQAAARQAAYAYIDSVRRFDAVLRPSNLATAIENAGATGADVTTFNLVGSSGSATLTATGAQYYDCAKDATGVVVS